MVLKLKNSPYTLQNEVGGIFLMALSSDVQSVSVSKKVKSVDFAVKSNVEILGEKQVYKLLSVKSNVAVKEITMQENNVIFNGNLYYDVLYITKNGDFEKANCIAEFSSKIDGSYKDVSIFASVVDTKTSISANGTMLEFNSAIKAECENVFKENIVVPQGLESLYTKKENISFCNISKTKSELFSLLDEISLSENVVQIININTTALVKNVDIKGEVVVVDFEVLKDITYVYGEEKLIKLERKTQSYKQEFANTFDGEIFVALDIKNEKVNLETNEENQTTLATCVCIVEAKFCCSQNQSFDVVCDAFSETNEVLLGKECFIIDEFVASRAYNEKLNVSVFTKNDMHEIISIGNLCSHIVSKNITQNTLDIEGVIVADIVYKDYNSNNVASQVVNAPFKVSIPCEVVAKDFDVCFKARVVGQKNKGEMGLDLIFDGYFDVIFSNPKTIYFVSHIDVKEEKSENMMPISIYLNDCEDSFSVAKGLNVSPEIAESLIQEDKNYVALFREIK